MYCALTLVAAVPVFTYLDYFGVEAVPNRPEFFIAVQSVFCLDKTLKQFGRVSRGVKIINERLDVFFNFVAGRLKHKICKLIEEIDFQGVITIVFSILEHALSKHGNYPADEILVDWIGGPKR